MKELFGFFEDAFGTSHEMLILVTELTADFYCADFIGHYGCEPYDRCSDKLQFSGRKGAIRRKAEELHSGTAEGESSDREQTKSKQQEE